MILLLNWRKIFLPITAIIAVAGIPSAIFLLYPQWWSVGVTSLLLGIGIILWAFPRWQISRLNAKGIDFKTIAELEDSYRRTLAQILGGAGVLVGIYFAWGNLDVSQKTLAQIDRRATAETFSRAIEQLSATNEDGHPKIESRLGSIFSLKQIAISSSEYFFPISDLFCAYVRENASIARNFPNRVADEKPREDVLAIIKILGDHKNFKKQTYDSVNKITIFKTSYYKLPNICLRHCELAHLEFNHANFSGSDFSSASFERVIFVYSDLRSSRFDNITTQSGFLDFTYGDLKGASFRFAKLSNASFSVARLDEVDFEGADFEGATFHHVDLSKAKGLTCEQLRKATLKETILPDHLKNCLP